MVILSYPWLWLRYLVGHLYKVSKIFSLSFLVCCMLCFWGSLLFVQTGSGLTIWGRCSQWSPPSSCHTTPCPAPRPWQSLFPYKRPSWSWSCCPGWGCWCWWWWSPGPPSGLAGTSPATTWWTASLLSKLSRCGPFFSVQSRGWRTRRWDFYPRARCWKSSSWSSWQWRRSRWRFPSRSASCWRQEEQRPPPWCDVSRGYRDIHISPLKTHSRAEEKPVILLV